MLTLHPVLDPRTRCGSSIIISYTLYILRYVQIIFTIVMGCNNATKKSKAFDKLIRN